MGIMWDILGVTWLHLVAKNHETENKVELVLVQGKHRRRDNESRLFLPWDIDRRFTLEIDGCWTKLTETVGSTLCGEVSAETNGAGQRWIHGSS